MSVLQSALDIAARVACLATVLYLFIFGRIDKP